MPFSEVLLRQLLLQNQPADVLGAVRQTVQERPEAFPSQSRGAQRSSYVRRQAILEGLRRRRISV